MSFRMIFASRRFSRGVSLVGYALLLGLIAIFALVTVQTTGSNVKGLFEEVSTVIEDEVPGVGEACPLPWGGTLSSGRSATAFAIDTVAFGEVCPSEQRLCTNGTLSGSLTYQSCSPEDPPGSFAFTTCGLDYRLGPEQADCDTAYQGGTLEGQVTVSAGYQTFTIPAAGTWVIRAVGAQGGDGQTTSVLGGRGAMVEGEFTLALGDVLRLVVGQRGMNGGDAGGGGGGGSYVALSDNTPLVVAGGGGGGAHQDAGLNADPATLADISDNGGAQGTNVMFGGAGFTAGPSGGNAQSFLAGARGATGSETGSQIQGGFGGGGWGTDDRDGIGEDRGGGGGGYRGGDGRFLNSGGGGLSFVNTDLGSVTDRATGAGSGNGSVTLTFVP
ncbi:MAG: hypothetical protein Alpg2KO_04570 [Alphaproteobacteria bacterium]